MAETVTINGQPYLKRNPLGVIGLSLITLGVCWLVRYYKVNVEVQRFENDPTMSPTRSLMAMIFGWLIIVPPFIAMYNTAKRAHGHLRVRERRVRARAPEPRMGCGRRRRRATGAVAGSSAGPHARVAIEHVPRDEGRFQVLVPRAATAVH